eukprot:scaffold39497_cov62-Phaeocystis_antarctica.AAC.3
MLQCGGGRSRRGHAWQPHLRGGDGDATASPRRQQHREGRRLGRAGRGAARVEGQVLHNLTLT